VTELGRVAMSSSTIRPPDTVKLRTEIGSSLAAKNRPAAPLTSAGLAYATNAGCIAFTRAEVWTAVTALSACPRPAGDHLGREAAPVCSRLDASVLLTP
jgi:hypothetical protein